MEYTIEIIGFLGVSLLGVISYFLRALHTDVKENIKQTTQNKTNIDILNIKAEGKIDKLAERTELQIQQLTKAISTMNETLMIFLNKD